MTSSIRRAALRRAVEALEARTLLSVELSYGTWIVRGDHGGEAADDVIRVEIVGKDATRLQAVVGGRVAGEIAVSEVRWLRVEAGDGDDRVKFGTLPEPRMFSVSVFGGGGSDTLYGSEGSEHLAGDAGDDVIGGRGGDDQLSGGEGDDLLRGHAGADGMHGGIGRDAAYGGPGNDWAEGGGGDDRLYGGAGNDGLFGDDGRDRLRGSAGADTIGGGTGGDRLRGGADGDQLSGGFDDDRVYGMKGDDTVWGGTGRDRIAGGAEADTIYHQAMDRPKWDELDVRLQEELVKPLDRQDDSAAIKAMLIEEAVENWRTRFGTSYTPYGQWRGYTRDESGKLVVSDEEAGAPGGVGCGLKFWYGEWYPSDLCGGGSDFSGTNTQEADVDEADLVKTDGQYLYVLEGSDLVIVDAWPAERTRVVSRTSVDGVPKGLYLDGDRVTVLAESSTPADPCLRVNDGEIEDGTRCDLDLRGSNRVDVLHFDVTDRKGPVLTERTEFDGWLTTSRAVDGRMYVVLGNSMDLPGLRRTWHAVPSVPEDWDVAAAEPLKDGNGDDIYGSVPVKAWDGQVWQIRGYYRYETEAEYRARLESMSLAELAPGYRVADGRGETRAAAGSLSVAGSFYTGDDRRDPYLNWWNMFSVVLIDPEDGEAGPDAVTSVLGMDGDVYASSRSLYLTAQEWDVPIGSWRGEHRTDIYKFDLGADSIDFAASGQVPGRMLNSFSMDEEGEHLRIATTSGGLAHWSNNVLVLRQEGREMIVTGGITGLAFSERLYSARFEGDRGYLVTFKKVDPLFTIDMSDPEEPKVIGELKIPGYSTYLHPVAEGLLLGVGRYADEEEGLAYGLQVSLFDASNFEKPVRLDVESFGQGRWEGSSLAEYNHHAFAYFPEQRIMAIPVTEAGPFDSEEPTYATVIMRVDGESGLTRIGRIEHEKEVWRNVRIEEFLYSIGAGGIKVAPLDDAENVMAEVKFT